MVDRVIVVDRVMVFGAAIAVSVFGIAVWRQYERTRVQRKVRALGELRGMSRMHIESVLGRPDGVERLGYTRALYTWTRPGYRLTLAFRADVCEGLQRGVGD